MPLHGCAFRTFIPSSRLWANENILLCCLCSCCLALPFVFSFLLCILIKCKVNDWRRHIENEVMKQFLGFIYRISDHPIINMYFFRACVCVCCYLYHGIHIVHRIMRVCIPIQCCRWYSLCRSRCDNEPISGLFSNILCLFRYCFAGDPLSFFCAGIHLIRIMKYF